VGAVSFSVSSWKSEYEIDGYLSQEYFHNDVGESKELENVKNQPTITDWATMKTSC
jgi:hypothetical protein